MAASTAAAFALALYVVFLLWAFGLRSVLHYRRTGSAGFRGVSGRAGSLEWWGGVLFVAAIVSGLAAPVLQLLAVVDPFAVLNRTWAHACGAILAVAGIAGTLISQRRMGASWRVGVDHQETTALVTTGAFALVRNPIFTAMGTAGFGLALLAPNVVALVALVVLVAAIHIQVRVVEEPYLLRNHGRSYWEYASRAGRFVPGIGRLTSRAISHDIRTSQSRS